MTTQDKVIEIISDTTGIDKKEITIDTQLWDYGIDGPDREEIVDAIYEVLGVLIDVDGWESVGDIVRLVEELL